MRKMGPRARLLYRRFERLIAECGPFDESPAKTRIAFLARVRFAGITRLSEEAMTCPIAMPYRLRSRRFAKAALVALGWWSHELRVTEPAELDAQVQAWLRRSYRLMGMQGRLKARAGPAGSGSRGRATRLKLTDASAVIRTYRHPREGPRTVVQAKR